VHKVERVTRFETVEIGVDSLVRQIGAQGQRRLQPEDGIVKIAAAVPPRKAAVRHELPPEELPDSV
jgi:hypothetical protein